MVKNLPANAEGMGSNPDPRRSHMPQSNKACEPQLVRLCSRAQEPQLLKAASREPVLRNKRSHHSEKPLRRNKEQPPLTATREKSAQQRRPSTAKKINKIIFKMVNHCVVQLTLIILYTNYTSIKNKFKKKVKAPPVWIFPDGALPNPPRSFKPWPPGSWVWLYKRE